jgi:futalosine hydrolase
MHILLVAATENEIAPILKELSFLQEVNPNLRNYLFQSLNVDVLVTGVGMTSTAFHLGKTLGRGYDFALNAGLAGSFNRNLALGDVVQVIEDCFSELGAEDGMDFIPVTALNLSADNLVQNHNSSPNPVLAAMPGVNGITVNTVHGDERSIERACNRFHPIVETMEGAAFLFACLFENIPCAQVRSVSNYVERRNREAWNIPLALSKLNASILEILNAFE